MTPSPPRTSKYEGRLVTDIAQELGVDPADALIDITAADDFKTVLWPLPAADTDDDWAVRRDLWERQDVLLGGSDAGAHLDRMLGSPYPTRFLADTLRGRKLVSLERAVQLMTDVPARLFGLRDRGRLEEGAFADVVVFDPETVDSGPARRVYDLPGDSLRLTVAVDRRLPGVRERDPDHRRRRVDRGAGRDGAALRPQHRHGRHALSHAGNSRGTWTRTRSGTSREGHGRTDHDRGTADHLGGRPRRRARRTCGPRGCRPSTPDRGPRIVRQKLTLGGDHRGRRG